MEDRIVRLPEVLNLAGISASTVYRLENNGEFPKRLNLSRSTVGYRLSDITAWIASRPIRNPGVRAPWAKENSRGDC